jgi:hypothetical protein
MAKAQARKHGLKRLVGKAQQRKQVLGVPLLIRLLVQ